MRAEPEHAELLASGRDAPGLGDLWYGLSARGRRTAAAAACLVLLAAGGYALTVQAPWQPARPGAGQGTSQEADGQSRQTGALPETALPSAAHRPPPYPAQSARITFDRLTETDAARRAFTVRLKAAASSTVTVENVDQGYEALELGLARPQPVTVRPGATRTLLLKAKVTDCDRLPLRARSPFLNVTLRNDRARQELSVIPGERYADALAHAFRTLCPDGGSATAPRP